ncbi:CAP family protein [Kaistia defluvii]|uniref:CAP family protein n=1 Tax=Kaistia defluvii TaxID=410841 RepID=UPI002258FE5C|nr:CAP family protein [Kaistia defluvii]MCX5521109.1 CAP family protein [Kaistia defluvii]
MSNARPRWNGSAIAALCLIAVLGLLAPVETANALTTIPPFGGVGDHDDTDMCPNGSYLIGAKIRSGAWLDQMALTCAPVDNMTGATGASKDVLPPRGGSGGGESSGTCLPGFIIHGVGMLMTPGDRQVRLMIFNCVSTTSADRHNLDLGNNAPVFPNIVQSCPAGEAAVGIRIRHGRHVNALGLICDTFKQITIQPPPEVVVVDCPDGGDEVPSEWSDMLKAHNERRAEHCAPKLKWCESLAKSAQVYASQCIVGSHDPNIAPNTGENIANATYIENGSPVLPALSDRDAFEQTWYCEIANYDFDDPAIVGGFTQNCQRVNGHFTQVVWKDSGFLGCGRATCEIGGVQGTQWVCRYRPAGNFNASDPFVLRQQVHRPLQPGQECE